MEQIEALHRQEYATRGGQLGRLHDRIDASFLKTHVKDWNQNFYLCGPDDMVKALRGKPLTYYGETSGIGRAFEALQV